MNLVLLVLLPLAGALLAWLFGRFSALAARLVSFVAMGAALALGIALWAMHPYISVIPVGGSWMEQLRLPWIPALGAEIYLALDGLSLLMVLLTALLGLLSVAVSWSTIRQRVGFFHFNLLLALAGVMGVFLALDLFLFYLFWELMLVPTFFLILLWGDEEEDRRRAAYKFFLFTQAGGLLLLVATLGLYFLHGAQTGEYTFDALRLMGTNLSAPAGFLLMMGFFLAFGVKHPIFGLHPWLPDAHTAAPTAGSVELAGLLLKTGAYGLIRFALPLFPMASMRLAPWAMALGVAGIIYGGMAAFRQNDLKRLIAYTSISHLGFTLLGIYAGNVAAMQGAVMLMVAHGLTTGALFILAGFLKERSGTRDLRRLGGLWTTSPRFAGLTLFFALAALGLPGLANFVGEFLVILGTFRVSIPFAAVAAGGMIVSVVYAVGMVRRSMQGPLPEGIRMPDLRAGDVIMLGALLLLVLWLGLFPQSVLDKARPFVEAIPYIHTGGGA